MDTTISVEFKDKVLINGAKYVDFDFGSVHTSEEFFEIVGSLWEQLETFYSADDLIMIDNLFEFLEIGDKWESTLDRVHLEEALKTPVVVEGVEYKKIRQFSLLYSGWECDSVGWLVDDNGEIKLVLTSHGGAYFGKISELEKFVKSYQKAITETTEIIEQLKSGAK